MKGVDQVVCLCGRNEELRDQLARDFDGDGRVRVEGFTDDMPDWLAAADALVHSTGGLTVLEALMRGCPAISYGWGRGHVRDQQPRVQALRARPGRRHARPRCATPSRPRSSRGAPRSTSRIYRLRPRSSSPRSNRECQRRCMRPERAVATLGLGALAVWCAPAAAPVAPPIATLVRDPAAAARAAASRSRSTTGRIRRERRPCWPSSTAPGVRATFYLVGEQVEPGTPRSPPRSPPPVTRSGSTATGTRCSFAAARARSATTSTAPAP